jgi:hypothetical protein
MNYGISAVRLDFGKEARVRTMEFFDIPGKRSQAEIVSSLYACPVDLIHFLIRFLLSIGSQQIAATITEKWIRSYVYLKMAFTSCFSHFLSGENHKWNAIPISSVGEIAARISHRGQAQAR